MRVLISILMLVAISSMTRSNDDLSKNWRQVDYYNNFYPVAMNCTDSSNCFVAGNLYDSEGPVIRKTTDGGLSWSTFWSDTSVFYFDSNSVPHYSYRSKKKIYSIACPSNDLVLAGLSAGKMIRTTNQGKTWDTINFIPKTWIQGIRMYDSKFGAFLLDTNVMLTFDGGLEWKKLQLPSNAVYPSSIQLLSPNDIIIEAGYKILDSIYSCIYKTNDLGKTWESNLIISEMTIEGKKQHISFNSVYFINNDVGWGLGGYVINHPNNIPPFYKDQHIGAIIYKTENAGKTWVQKLNLYDTTSQLIWPLTKIRFSDELNGYAVGVENMLYRTNDGGESWHRESNDSMARAEKYSIGVIEFKGKTRLIAGKFARIYKYYDEISSINDGEFVKTTSVDLFPNPAKDYISVSLLNPMLKQGVEKVEIYSIEGIQMQSTSPQPSPFLERAIQIDVSGFVPGVYFVKVGNIVQRFVKI